MSGTPTDELITGNIMNDLEYVKRIMQQSYKSSRYTYEETVISNFELTYVLNHPSNTDYINWLRQFFPNSFTAEIPPHIMEMAIDQIKANHLMRDVL